MDFHISPEQRQMLASVRDLAQSEFKPKAGRWMDGSFPWENMRQLATLGVLGMSVPSRPRLSGCLEPLRCVLADRL